MELLGSSQTFLGTLATLTILCVFHNKSNFILNILGQVKKNFQNEINSLRINTKFENITESSDYKLLNRYLNDSNNDPKLREEGIKLMSEISVAEQQLQIQYAPVENQGDVLIDRIYKSEEQILSPLYTFGYCIILFIFDELLRIPVIGHTNYFCSTLTVFSLFSAIFWIFVWGKFLIKYIPKQKTEFSSTTTNNKRKTLNKKIQSFFFKLSIISICILMGMFLCHACLPYEYYPFGIIFLLICPIICIGVLKLFPTQPDGSYSHLFILSHLTIFLFLAFCFCFIIFLYIYSTNNYNQWLQPFHIHSFKIATFIAILLNGLILPFIMPYICYYSIYYRAQKDVRKSEKESQSLTHDLLQELTDFCHKIPS